MGVVGRQPDFATWYEMERPALYATLAAITGDRAIAQDAADEALARAFERWPRVSLMESPAGWTYVTALNLVRRRAHRRGLEQRALGRFARRAASDPAEDLGLRLEVREALEALPPAARTVAALYYVADRPVAEIAATLGISIGTVTSTLTTARVRLRRAFVEGEVPA
ncbi:MAG TPA: sigma-70 family RNA polymerase sigma factor [Acidimicrobiales bacterium]|jgi:RNA polymerase sigma-70 factor (ECF subfamily)